MDRYPDQMLARQAKEKLGLTYEETETQKAAREIMGRNFLGIPEVEKHFGELTDEQREALSVIPFSEETLTACVSTHVLVADVGLSLLDVRSKARKGLFYNQDWYDEGQEFAKRMERAFWRLIRKTSVEGLFFENSVAQRAMSWSDQQALIDSKVDEIPSTRQVVYTMILHFLATGERLFEKVYVRTSDVDSVDGTNVYVGHFVEAGLVVGDWHGHVRRGSLGVASARKSPQ